jgi:arylsulfatase A-like enzyme
MVAYLDDSVAEFTGLLPGAGMWDNTLLFFSTDNGGCAQGA